VNRVAAFGVALLLTAPMTVGAGGHRGGHSSSTRSYRTHSSSHSSSYRSSSHHSSGAHTHRTTSLSSTTYRTSQGSTKRDPHQRAKFMRSHPCPSTGKTSGACPGYVVDHRVPLKRGGTDSPSNMQWQIKEAAKAKDKWE